VTDYVDLPISELVKKLSRAAEVFDSPQLQQASNTIKALQVALFDHNEVLRSAYQVAERRGVETSWDSFRDQCSGILKKHHEIANLAREALDSHNKP
jgi:hypothetical protein